MKKIIAMIALSAFLFATASLVLAESAASIKANIAKIQKEIDKLEAKMATTKNKVHRTRIQNTISDYKRRIGIYRQQLSASEPAPAAPHITVAPMPGQMQKIVAAKGGLAGGAALIAADFLMPVGPVYLGGEAGYAIGNNFGVIDLGGKVIYSFGAPFAGLEISYAGYSQDVTNVPGLSGTIKSGVGIGIIGGTTMGPIQLGVGFNTLLGARADAGYRFYF